MTGALTARGGSLETAPVARRRTLQASRHQGAQPAELEPSPLHEALLKYLESLP